MIHFSNCASLLRRHAATLCGLVAGFALVSAARAVTLDFNVPNGNYTVAGNWVDATTGAVSASAPTYLDNAYVRNGGTLLITSDVSANQLRIGHENVVTSPDYNGDGVVDAGDYVIWRKGGPLLNDLTPDTVGPEDYTLWRPGYGAVGAQLNLGKPSTLLWTAGKITGPDPAVVGGDPYAGGPAVNVGRIRTTNGVVDEVVGTVIQNGPTTELLLPYRQSQLTIGEINGSASVHNPGSSYTLIDGTIGVGIASSLGLGSNQGTNGNNGINVRNGTFNMSGGKIIDVTPADYLTSPLTVQRFLTIADAGGTVVGNEAVATANISGGSVNVYGGIRMALKSHSRGYLNISGATTSIVTGGNTSIGYQDTAAGSANAVGELNMSGGSFSVGRTDVAGQDLRGSLVVGDRGKGLLNISGGTITVTRDIRVGARNNAGGSVLTMTGGTIVTRAIEMGNTQSSETPTSEYGGAAIIIDGPTASFTQTGESSGTTSIGNLSSSLFEVRQGTALLGGAGSSIDVGESVSAAATINLKGGKLTLAGTVTRGVTNPNPTFGGAAPVFGLTGGTLEFNNPTLAAAGGVNQFRADLTNAGSKLIIKPNLQQSVQVGGVSPAYPANFSMTGGSWDIEIGTHAVTGADSFSVPNGTASLTGGTLNISYLSGYTPTAGDVFNIVTSNSAPTLGTVAIAGSGSPNWSLQTLGNIIQLKWNGAGSGSGAGLDTSAVPEPSSMALVGFAVAGLLSARRTRSRTK